MTNLNKKIKLNTIILLFQILIITDSYCQTPKKNTQKIKSTQKSSIPQSYQNNLNNSKFQNGFADIIEGVMPAVVNISTSQDVNSKNLIDDDYNSNNSSKNNVQDDNNRFKEPESRNKISSIGSGFIISKDGYIVTNGHVIKDANDININLADGNKYKAKIIGIDKKSDIALLKINPNYELKFAKFGNSNSSRIGDWAIVIGNPYGLGGSVSIGIISARGREINNGQINEYIQTDAAINKGNSGGPLFNATGEVIGVNSAIFSPSGGSVGIGFATPSNNIISIINQLKNSGEVSRGWIGASIQEVTQELADSLRLEKIRGAFISDVVIAGPADKAGIIPTDIIIKFDDVEIDNIKSLTKIVSNTQIGKNVKILVWRQNKVKSLNIMIEKSKDDDNFKKIDNKIEKKSFNKNQQIMGLNLIEYKNNNLEALQIIDINPKSEAYDKGLMNGDIILSVNQTNVSSINDFNNIINQNNQKNSKIFLFIKRNENKFPVVLNIK